VIVFFIRAHFCGAPHGNIRLPRSGPSNPLRGSTPEGGGLDSGVEFCVAKLQKQIRETDLRPHPAKHEQDPSAHFLQRKEINVILYAKEALMPIGISP
jgi:hypothetical protein